MNIVVDTNILVSGLLSPYGACGKIVRMISSGELSLSFDARIILEYGEVLKRPKFRLAEDRVTAFLEYLELCGKPTAASPLIDSLPDSDDEPFLEVAIASRVVCIVTGNQKHFPAELCREVEVLSPSDFLTMYQGKGRT